MFFRKNIFDFFFDFGPNFREKNHGKKITKDSPYYGQVFSESPDDVCQTQSLPRL